MSDDCNNASASGHQPSARPPLESCIQSASTSYALPASSTDNMRLDVSRYVYRPCCNKLTDISHGRATPMLPRPPSLCEACWEGPFAAHLGLLSEPLDISGDESVGRGYAYTTSWAALESRASAPGRPDSGCQWCRLVLDTREEEDTSTAPLRVVVGALGEFRRACTPQGTQGLSIYINGRHGFSGHVYTSSGWLRDMF